LEKALHRVSETETPALRLVVPPAVLADPTRDVAAKSTRTHEHRANLSGRWGKGTRSKPKKAGLGQTLGHLRLKHPAA
jgi:hypothetical protein